MAVLIICKSEEDLIKNGCYCLDNVFLSLFDPQGQITPMTIGETGLKSSLSKILCMSLLSASLMISNQSLSARQHFPYYMFMGA